MNCSIDDVYTISDATTEQINYLVQKMHRSNQKLSIFIAENVFKHCHYNELMDDLIKREGVSLSPKVLLDYLIRLYPETKINFLVQLCRVFLCHDIEKCLQEMMAHFNYQEGEHFDFDDELNVRCFLSQLKR